MMTGYIKYIVFRTLYIAIILLLLGGCSSYIKKENQISKIVEQLKIGMQIQDVNNLFIKYEGKEPERFLILFDELKNACLDEKDFCHPSNLYKVVKIRKNGDVIVITPAVGMYRHKRLIVSEYLGVFFNRDSGKIIGWVHFSGD